MMNITLRPTKTKSASEGRFPNQRNLILKYAPPFAAGVGEKLPITTFRQVIEGRALSLFSVARKDSLRSICSRSIVMVPELLHHDLDSNVLIMSDIGPLPNLSSVFSHLGGYGSAPFPSPSSHSLSPSPNSSPSLAPSITYYTVLGTKLGSFFALLHSHSTLSAILSDPSRGPDFFTNPHLKNFAFENGIVPIKANLLLFSRLLDKEEAEVLYERVARNIKEPILEEERAFTLADCWPGSVLIGHLPGTTGLREEDEWQERKIEKNGRVAKVAVVDWEFASIGRGVNNDIAQLMARLALLHTAAICRGDSISQRELTALHNALTVSYRKTSLEENAIWTAKLSLSEEKFARLDPKSLRAKMLRSTFLTFGAEMMRCAFAKDWNCQDTRCMSNAGGKLEHTARKEDCAMIQAMVEYAVWYFRTAREDESDFCGEESVRALTRARVEGRWLMSLF